MVRVRVLFFCEVRNRGKNTERGRSNIIAEGNEEDSDCFLFFHH